VRTEPAYQAYVVALGNLGELPHTEAADLEEIERRFRSEFDALDRTRRDAAERWVSMRDNSSRLSRRVDELARRVGAAPASGAVSDLLAPAALAGALESLRSELERADQAWQWVLRHRERRAVPPVAASPPPAPVYIPPPAAEPKPDHPTKSVDPKLLLAVAAAVIVVLVIVVILMAV
jgi:hypothetical protein